MLTLKIPNSLFIIILYTSRKIYAKNVYNYIYTIYKIMHTYKPFLLRSPSSSEHDLACQNVSIATIPYPSGVCVTEPARVSASFPVWLTSTVVIVSIHLPYHVPAAIAPKSIFFWLWLGEDYPLATGSNLANFKFLLASSTMSFLNNVHLSSQPQNSY